MPTYTDNFGLQLFSEGETPWTHAPDMETIEQEVTLKRPRAPDTSQDTPHDGATYLDTSTGEIYTADGTAWNLQWNLGNIGTGGETVTPANGRATLSADQSISTGTTTVVPFDGTAFDSTGSFDSTNHTFTVPTGEGGIYFVSGVARYTSVPADTRLVFRAEANGSFRDAISGENQSSIAGGNLRIVFSGLVSLAAGDTLRTVTYQDSGSSQNLSSQTTFSFVRVDQAASGGDGGGATSADLITSPNLNMGYSELAAGAALQQPVSVADGQTITVYAWGATDTAGNTPTGLEVELRDNTGSIVASENTAWTSNTNGITNASWTNSTGGRVDAVLAIANGTGTAYTDPDGVGGRFGYEVS